MTRLAQPDVKRGPAGVCSRKPVLHLDKMTCVRVCVLFARSVCRQRLQKDLKLLVPHEVERLFDFGDGAGTLAAEVGGGPALQIVGALLLADEHVGMTAPGRRHRRRPREKRHRPEWKW